MAYTYIYLITGVFPFTLSIGSQTKKIKKFDVNAPTYLPLDSQAKLEEKTRAKCEGPWFVILRVFRETSFFYLFWFVAQQQQVITLRVLIWWPVACYIAWFLGAPPSFTLEPPTCEGGSKIQPSEVER